MTSMQNCLLGINLLVGVVFLISFVMTFAARQYIDTQARDFAREKTEQHATPLVTAAEILLQGELAARLLPNAVIDAARHEARVFRQNPTDYVAQLVRPDAQPTNALTDVPYAETIFGWKDSVREYYDAVLASLIRDLRIFTGTNVVAALLAAFLVWHPSTRTKRSGAVLSAVLLIALVYNVWLYIDSAWFFRILFNAYLGWWYPIAIGLTTFGLFRKWKWLSEENSTDRCSSAPR
ncbi:MAG: hypothetical protein AAF432_07110 [Planctomycetota bacterium]